MAACIAQWQASTLKHHVEYLVAARQKGASLPAETSVWLEQLDDDLRGKLTGVGLIEARESDQTPTTLGAFLDAYIARRADVKPATVTNYRQTTANLVAFYGCDRELRSITAAAAADFLQYLVGEGLAPRTIARRIQNARMFMSDAATRNLVASNPFDRIRVKSKKKPRNHAYVPRCDIEQLLTVCDPTWQIIVALSRYAGLRCPSEVLSLRWEMVDFGSGRMVVDSPKTEHHDQSSRTIPIFKALRPILEQARRQALPDAVYVVPGRYRDACLKEGEWKNCNLRTQLRKLISRAGLQPWPVAFHSLRSSCETDLIRAG